MLEVVAPFKHFNKLKEFVAMKLPAGFPVRIGLFSLCSLFEILVIVSALKNATFCFFRSRFFGMSRDELHLGGALLDISKERL